MSSKEAIGVETVLRPSKTSQLSQERTIPLDDLLKVVDLAATERWPELAIVGPEISFEFVREQCFAEWPISHVFRLDDHLVDVSPLLQLTHLRALYLGDHRIGGVGARALATLTALTNLDLTQNPDLFLETRQHVQRGGANFSRSPLIPLDSPLIGPEGAHSLASLTELRSLSLFGCRIGPEGARSLASLTKLRSLDLSHCDIGPEGARSLDTLTELRSLTLSNCNIEPEGARSLVSLTKLSSLNLSDCNIGSDAPRSLSSLTELKSLDLTDCGIGPEGARSLTSLTKLTSLKLRGCQIGPEGARALLDAWCDGSSGEHLEYLELGVESDHDSVLPPEALGTNDAQAILAAYRRFHGREAQKLQPLREARVLVLGNEAVGKTSLIRYLVDDEFRDPNEQKTPGARLREKIEVHSWLDSSAVPLECDVKLNVWDFGQQFPGCWNSRENERFCGSCS
jgi:hypothetical protein